MYNRRGEIDRYTEQRGALPKRATLVEHDSGWTEFERDAVIMLECHIANRGSWRPGDAETTPLTLAHHPALAAQDARTPEWPPGEVPPQLSIFGPGIDRGRHRPL